MAKGSGVLEVKTVKETSPLGIYTWILAGIVIVIAGYYFFKKKA